MRNVQKLMFLMIVIFLLFFYVTVSFASVQDIDYSESDEIITNPDRGFYELIQVEFNKDSNKIDKFEKQISNVDDSISLISFQLNLKQFVKNNDELTDGQIETINNYFDIMRKNGYKVIFRVVYDNKGEANPEPEFSTIIQHIDKLKKVYEDNEDILYVIEAGYLGKWGEWHGGKYTNSVEKKNLVIKELLQVIPKSITINLRKPDFINNYLQGNNLNENNAFTGEDVSRLGLHNDGYLASNTDYGTYEENDRTETLKWQNNLTKYTIFGGECVKAESTYNDLKNAILDMQNRHCSYLNYTYDEEVKEKWKKATYDGENGYKYIQNHLGYRLVLKQSEIVGNNVNLKIQNTGFGNIINNKKVKIILQNNQNSYEIDTNIDVRKKLLAGQINELNIDLNLPKDFKSSEYRIYLKISERGENLQNSKYSIKLANNDTWNSDLSANYIGIAKIENNNSNAVDTKGNNNWLIKLAILIVCVTVIVIVILKK